MYENEKPGTIRADSEYVSDEEEEGGISAYNVQLDRVPLTQLIIVGEEAAGTPKMETHVIEAIEGATEAEEGPRRSTRERRQVQRLEVSHAPMHQKAKTRQKKKLNKPKQSAKAAGKESKPQRDKKQEKAPETPVGEDKELSDAYTPADNQDQTKESELTKLPEAHTFTDSEGNIVEALRGQYKADGFFKSIAENPSHFKNFIVEDGVIYIKTTMGKALCVPDVKIGGEKVREVVIRDMHKMLAHAGYRKTKYAMRGRVWWRSMVADIKDYCSACRICATSKQSTQSKAGLLAPLEVISEPWRRIQVDFVGPLPESENLQGKWDMLCVFIDQATLMVRLAATKQTYWAKDIAEVLCDTIYKLHGMPEVIVSDRDKLFTSKFWRELHRLTGIQLRMSSEYHPETNGLTEHANKSVVQMIRQSIEGRQKDWARCLPCVEHTMNLGRSESTGFSLFFLNFGQYPTGAVWETDSIYPGVRTFLTRHKEALQMAHDQLIDARTRMTAQANKHQRPADFKVGDLTYLSTKNMRLPKKVARKLVPKYFGPHQIVKEVVSGTTYKIDLPLDLKNRGIHPVFHASLLRIHVANNDRKFPGQSGEQVVPLTNTPNEWAVDGILQHAGKGKEISFEVKWKSGDITWEPYDTVKHLEAFNEYLELQGVSSVMGLKWTAEYGDEEREFGDEEGELERAENEQSEEEKGTEEGIKDEETSLQVFSIRYPLMPSKLQLKPMFPIPPLIPCPPPQSQYTFTANELVDCGIYCALIVQARLGRIEYPGLELDCYQEFRSMLYILGEAEGGVCRAVDELRDKNTLASLKETIKDLKKLNMQLRTDARPTHSVTRPAQRAYSPPINAPTGPRAERLSLAACIGQGMRHGETVQLDDGTYITKLVNKQTVLKNRTQHQNREQGQKSGNGRKEGAQAPKKRGRGSLKALPVERQGFDAVKQRRRPVLAASGIDSVNVILEREEIQKWVEGLPPFPPKPPIYCQPLKPLAQLYSSLNNKAKKPSTTMTGRRSLKPTDYARRGGRM